MYSFTAKRVTWKKVMISSWTGLILPRTAPKATQVDATQKSASMMLSRDKTREELELHPEATLQAFGPLWTETGGLILLSLRFTLCDNGLILVRTIHA